MIAVFATIYGFARFICWFTRDFGRIIRNLARNLRHQIVSKVLRFPLFFYALDKRLVVNLNSHCGYVVCKQAACAWFLSFSRFKLLNFKFELFLVDLFARSFEFLNKRTEIVLGVLAHHLDDILSMPLDPLIFLDKFYWVLKDDFNILIYLTQRWVFRVATLAWSVTWSAIRHNFNLLTF